MKNIVIHFLNVFLLTWGFNFANNKLNTISMQNNDSAGSIGGVIMLVVLIGGIGMIFLIGRLLNGPINKRNDRIMIKEIEKYYSKFEQFQCKTCGEKMEFNSLFCSNCGDNVA